jgi:hypothetical protein
MEALGLPAAMPRVALKLATAFFGHGEAQRVINLSRFDNPDSCPFWTVRRETNHCHRGFSASAFADATA